VSAPTLFLDRDGTLIEEPTDQQVDHLSKIRFMPGVFPALLRLTEHGYRFVMVSNQDGLGSLAYPRTAFESCQQFILDAFESQGIRFDAVFICPHRARDDCACRKPRTGLLDNWLSQNPIDLSTSAVIGDRATDLEFAANLGVPGYLIIRQGSPEKTWPFIVQTLTERRGSTLRKTRETSVDVRVNLDREAPLSISTHLGFFDHMLEQLAKHGGFALELNTRGDLHVDEHHTVEDTALALGQALRSALGTKHGIARYGFVLPMDEAESAVCVDLSGRAFTEFSGHFGRDSIGRFPTELVPHFFRSLSEGLGAALHVSVRGENTHHMIEAAFKGVGRCLRQAFRRDGSLELPSTKGAL